MTAEELLDEMRMLGVRLEVHGDRLHVEAPKGILKPEHREAFATFKPELIALVQASAAELEASRQRLERLDISIAVRDDGVMRITESMQSPKDGETIYTPAD